MVLAVDCAAACCCALAKLQERGWGWPGHMKRLKMTHAASQSAFWVGAAACALAELQGQLRLLGAVVHCCCLPAQLAPLLQALARCRAPHRAGTQSPCRDPPAQAPLRCCWEVSALREPVTVLSCQKGAFSVCQVSARSEQNTRCRTAPITRSFVLLKQAEFQRCVLKLASRRALQVPCAEKHP